jgi:hypothetical protein
MRSRHTGGNLLSNRHVHQDVLDCDSCTRCAYKNTINPMLYTIHQMVSIWESLVVSLPISGTHAGLLLVQSFLGLSPPRGRDKDSVVQPLLKRFKESDQSAFVFGS